MMGHMEDTFLTSGRDTKYCILVITGEEFLRMLPDMLEDVIVSKEWVELCHRTRCLYNLRSSLNLLRSGLLILQDQSLPCPVRRKTSWFAQIMSPNGQKLKLCSELQRNVDVFVTSECIHLCILCLVTQRLFRDVSII